ncbi:O-antigen ligase family protein [Glutamicibacter sp. NPDC090743]|uniref:O-antigen ligase family protein n=1 Tax=Glutamicibacter sp. NPDC090743 TaxID=3364001 RepID=UPI0037FC9118
MLDTRGSRRLTEPERSERIPVDAVTGLTFYVFVLLLVPSDRTVAQLGGAGTPAALLSIGLMVWWLWYRTRVAIRVKFTNPVYLTFLAFAVAVMISEVVAAASYLPQEDQNAADMGILRLASYAGAFFVAADGIQSKERLATLCRRLVAVGALVALLGLIQFFTGTAWIDRLPTPGLASVDNGMDLRGGYLRPQGTARHALEFAGVVSGIAPLALALCIGDRSRNLVRRVLPVAILMIVSFLSLTRSALVGVALGVLPMMPFWSPRLRRRAVLLGIVGAGATVVALPSVARAVMNMFSGSDSSVNSRTDSWDFAFLIFNENPIFGRGFGTFLPAYRILDNQLLLLLLEIGIVGALAFAAMLGTGVYCAIAGRNNNDNSLHNHLGLGISASIIASGTLMAFFDSFSFPQAPGVLFLVLGMSASYWRISKSSGRINPKISMPITSKKKAHLMAVAAAGIVLLLTIPTVQMVRATPSIYWGKQDLIFLPPSSSVGGNSLRTDARDLVPFASMVQETYIGLHGPSSVEPVAAPIYGTGISHGEFVRVPNAGGQWQTYQRKATITVEVVAATEDDVLSRMDRTMAELTELAEDPQKQMKVVHSAHIITDVYPKTAVAMGIHPRTKWALLLLGFMAIAAAAAAHDLVLRKTGWA